MLGLVLAAVILMVGIGIAGLMAVSEVTTSYASPIVDRESEYGCGTAIDPAYDGRPSGTGLTGALQPWTECRRAIDDRRVVVGAVFGGTIVLAAIVAVATLLLTSSAGRSRR